MELVFASSNLNKLREIRTLIPEGYTLSSLSDLKYSEELEETGTTLRENALQKARFVHKKFGVNCFADDSGLEVHALGNEPGVHSAYYAGLPRDDKKNMTHLLNNLAGKDDRKASFKTVIALIIDTKEYVFQGELKGRITYEPLGAEGFGYDPVFIPDGFDKTLAELGLEIKNTISHRKKAIHAMMDFLRSSKSTFR